ncbi:MAG: hypothetical protein FJ041_05770, partial [Candidatus Cloacimonetes bacterium]|nr:hypothetical protein [Candidatus Cloacimonadota bacterium]
DKNRFIIDFKTGEGELLQLMFYKWTYYLLDNPSMQDRVRAAFCLIKEKSMDWLEECRKSQPEILIEKITESLDKLVTEGFVSTNDLLFGDTIPDIIRRDLKGFLSTDEDSYESAD